MNCPNCSERVKDPMSLTCEHCEFDLTKPDEQFVEQFDRWLSDRIDAGDISHFKAKFLLHLATKHLRPVSIVDLWPKKPNDVQGKVDEKGHISLGEVYPYQDVALSYVESDSVTLFPYRDPPDDPYIRVLMRQDVPLIQLDVVFEKLIAFFTEIQDKKSGAKLPVDSKKPSTQHEYWDFEWKAKEGEKFDHISAKMGFNTERGDALNEPYARIHFWQKHQAEIMQQLQPYLNEGWQPISEVGPSCIKIVESYKQNRGFMKGLLSAAMPNWDFIGVEIKLQRPQE